MPIIEENVKLQTVNPIIPPNPAPIRKYVNLFRYRAITPHITPKIRDITKMDLSTFVEVAELRTVKKSTLYTIKEAIAAFMIKIVNLSLRRPKKMRVNPNAIGIKTRHLINLEEGRSDWFGEASGELVELLAFD